MGTNYYVAQKPCPHCGRGEDRIHIGKSSAGWVFALNTHPDLGINTLADWLAFLPGKEIEDEYGTTISLGNLVETITQRIGGPKPHSAQWLVENRAVEGPNNLARAQIGGHGAIAHGEGAWDYHRGEFC